MARVFKRKAQTITIDIPTFIRCLELAREDIKDDESIHVFTTALVGQTQPIGMEQYMKAVKSIHA